MWLDRRVDDDDDDDDGDDENKPIWPPIWAVRVLSGVRDVETYNRGRPSKRSLRGFLV